MFHLLGRINVEQFFSKFSKRIKQTNIASIDLQAFLNILTVYHEMLINVMIFLVLNEMILFNELQFFLLLHKK